MRGAAWRDGAASISGFFRDYAVKELQPESGKLVVMDGSVSLMQAYRVFEKNACSSAIFWDATTPNQHFIVTLSDLMTVLLAVDTTFFSARRARDPSVFLRQKGHKYDGRAPTHEDVLSLLPLRKYIAAKPHTRVHEVSSNTSIHEGLRLMFAHGVHRLPVFEQDRHGARSVQFILTYLHVCRFLVSRFRLPARTLGQTVASAQLGDPEGRMRTVPAAASVRAALACLLKYKLSVIPVVDARGRFVDVFSKYDFSFLRRKGPDFMLTRPVSAALRLRPASAEGAFTATPSFTVGELVVLIARRSLHRLVILRPDRTIARIISLRHVLAFLLSIELK
eukprot:gnl/Chilomastix_cuspidata/5683.p1 GENE.gnl/Chilomastix_cuspidata/5683~~gnl/Chilomastix_cuspidata/5683.p1  ORF type:complete len:336 (-),score=117.38 gnl/Chilomastix_cuspidata/5683:57-1064(-)